MFLFVWYPFTHVKLILGVVNSTSFMQSAAECEEVNRSLTIHIMLCRREYPTTSH